MNERCVICRHSPASHRDWGNGHCEARGCTCKEYEAPPLWAPGVSDEDKARHLRQMRTFR